VFCRAIAHNLIIHLPEVVPQLWRNIVRMRRGQFQQARFRGNTANDRQRNCGDSRRATHARSAANEGRSPVANESRCGFNGHREKAGAVSLSIQDREPAIQHAARQLGKWFLVRQVDNRLNPEIVQPARVANVGRVANPQTTLDDFTHALHIRGKF